MIHDDAGNWRPACYYISRVLVGYLIEFKGVTIGELMDPDVSGIETFGELPATCKNGSARAVAYASGVGEHQETIFQSRSANQARIVGTNCGCKGVSGSV